MATAYEGELHVEPNDFSLAAERLILNGDHLSFHLTGEDDEGAFEIEAVAAKGEDGAFHALKVPYTYKGWADNYYATIVFSQVAERPRTCKLVGQWIDEDGSWTFHGTLRKFSAK